MIETLNAKLATLHVDGVDASYRERFYRYAHIGPQFVEPRVWQHEERENFDRESFRALASAGFFLDFSTEMTRDWACFDGLCSTTPDMGFLISVLAHGIACRVIGELAQSPDLTELQAQMLEGTFLAAVANSEPHGGTDVRSVRTRAYLRGNEVLFSGRKRCITNVSEADVILMSARTIRDASHDSRIEGYVLRSNTPRLWQRSYLQRTTLRTSPTGDLIMHRSRHPISARLCDGFILFRRCYDLERLGVAVLCVGALRQLWNKLCDWSIHHTTLLEHQYVQEHVLTVWRALIQTHAMTEYLKEHPSEIGVSLVKTDAIDAALGAVRAASRLLGSDGISRHSGLDKLMRDLVGLQLLGGTREQHQIVAFRQLLGKK